MFIGKLEYYGHVETVLYTRLDARPPTPERREAGYKVSGGVILGTSAHRRRPSTPKTVYFKPSCRPTKPSACCKKTTGTCLTKLDFCLPMYLISYAYFRHVAV